MHGLINIQIKIYTIFRRLLDLEIKGRKNDKKYNDIKADLIKKIAKEEEILKTIDLDLISPEKLNNIIEEVGTLDQSLLIRFLCRFTDLVIADAEKKQNVEGDNTSYFLRAVHNNHLILLAKYLNDALKETTDEFERRFLLECFYETCYTCPQLSKLIVDDTFDLSKDCYKEYYFIADILKINREEAESLADDYCAELYFKAFGRIFSDERLANPKILHANRISIMCIIKSLESMLSTEGYKRASSSVLKAIKEQDLTNHPNYEYAMSLIASPERPKTEVTTISFGRPLKK